MQKSATSSFTRRAFARVGRLLFADHYYRSICYSQEGEDLILQRIFQGRPAGFYVDIGAHHPRRFSNTYLLYKKGWRGINVDAAPGSMNAFKKARPRDINCELGIAATEGKMLYYVFNEPALNTFSKAHAEAWAKRNPYRVKHTLEIATMPLAKLLDEKLPRGVNIDVLSVDVEGYDAEVLTSNDWTRYVPEVVVVEDHQAMDCNTALTTMISRDMQSRGYRLASHCIYSSVYRRH